MNKNVFGRKLGRDKEERKALFKSLMSSLVLKESIKTTEEKAKAIRSEIEKLITKAKTAEKGSMAVLHKSLSKQALDKIVKEIGPRFAKRPGGYTRIIKLGERFGDNASYVLIEFVEKAEVVIPVKEDKKSKAKPEIKEKKEVKKTEKKVEKKSPSSRKAKKDKK